MNLVETLKWRYSTKTFDNTKKISDEDFEQIKSLLQLSPSSVNSQPWHFVIANSEEGKKRIAKSTEGFFVFNKAKVMDASHVIVFCTKTEADEKYLQHVLAKEESDGRFPKPEIKEQVNGGRTIFTNIHRYDLKDVQHWMDKQAYLNMGNLLLGAAALKIDAVPMEGIDMKALDEEFGLREKGFTAIAVVSLGYRAEDDFNAALPKSRLAQDEIFTLLD